MAKKESNKEGAKEQDTKDNKEEMKEASLFLGILENSLEQNEWELIRNSYKINDNKKSQLDATFDFDFDSNYEPMIDKGFDLASELFDTLKKPIEDAQVWEIKKTKYTHGATNLRLIFTFELLNRKDRDLIRGNRKIDDYS